MLTKLNQLINHYLHRLIVITLALLGFSSCGDDEEEYPALMYGPLYSTFEVKGTITNSENNPINGAEVISKMGHWTENGVIFYPGNGTRTDQNGEYVLEITKRPFDYVRIIAIDETTQIKDSTEFQIVPIDKPNGGIEFPDDYTINITLKTPNK